MQDKLFLFFGCSWTYGKFINIKPGQDSSTVDPNEELELANRYSYRGLLSHTFKADQINFSEGASSNTRQFRLASQYFLGPDRHNSNLAKLLSENYRRIRDQSWPTVDQFVSSGQLSTDILDQIKTINQIDDFEIFRKDPRPKYVFWFITSTARIENYNSTTRQFENEFLNNTKSQLSKLILTDYYDHKYEIEKLAHLMTLWNAYFKQHNIKNVWIDTFNHHDYPIEIDNRIVFNSDFSDLMSNMCLSQGFKDFKSTDFHSGLWASDDPRSSYLYDHNFLNNQTLHPTIKGHKLIADIIIPKIVDHFDFKDYNQVNE